MTESSRRRGTGRLLAALLTTIVLLGACGSDTEPDTSAGSPSAPSDDDDDGGDADPGDSEGASEAPGDDSDAGEDAASAADGDKLYFYPPREGATFTQQVTGPAPSMVAVTVASVDEKDGETTVTVSEDVGDGVIVERTFITGADGGLAISAEGFGAGQLARR